MSARAALRVGVAGATGMLGSELLVALEESEFPIEELLPIASSDSRGDEFELRGESYPVVGDDASLGGLDLLMLCAPQPISLELARRALHAHVPVLDLSGALAGLPDVPLIVADRSTSAEALRAPIVAAPAGPALAWSLVLAPLADSAGLSRVVGTVLASASTAGRAGVEALSSESIALFNQQEVPEPGVLGSAVAFDCVPVMGTDEGEGDTTAELELARSLRRTFGAGLRLALTMVRVPTFAGDGATLVIETTHDLSVEDARLLLAKAPGVVLVDSDDPCAATTRSSAGRDAVLVGRVRRDPSCDHGLQLWLAADGVRLSAAHGARLAAAWLAAR